ncbi:hypothetical protein ACRAKI_09460 [Saccharothrix isguenensis]
MIDIDRLDGMVSLPLLIVTGAAAAGKSTACRALSREPAVLALDGDVLAAGAAAVAYGRIDYPAFWRYAMSISNGIADNGLVPVICGVCLPHQVLTNSEECKGFAGVHFFALTCAPDELERRIRARVGAESAVRNIAKHLSINAHLQQGEVAPPHTLTVFDNTGLACQDTTTAVRDWVLSIPRS